MVSFFQCRFFRYAEIGFFSATIYNGLSYVLWSTNKFLMVINFVKALFSGLFFLYVFVPAYRIYMVAGIASAADVVVVVAADAVVAICANTKLTI